MPRRQRQVLVAVKPISHGAASLIDNMEINPGKKLRSAFDSTTFDTDISIHVHKDLNDIGSATISPSGRDVAIAS